MKTISEDIKNRPVGRPTKYKPEYIDQALHFIGDMGKSVTQFARHLRVNKSSIYQWAEVYPEFSDALEMAKQWCQGYWEDELEKMMFDKGVNAPLVKLYFANRFGWHDKQEERGEESAPPPISYSFQVSGPVDEVKITNAKTH